MASRVAMIWVSCLLLLAAACYKRKCPSAEFIVKTVVDKALKSKPGLGAGIIRMAFHDCFVQVRSCH